MQYTTNNCLTQFKFWGEAKKVADRLSYQELVKVDELLSDYFSNNFHEPSASDINDAFWFNTELIVCEFLGYKSEESFEHLTVSRYQS